MQSTKKEYRLPRTGEIAAFLSRHTHTMKEYGDELRFRPCPKCGGDNGQNPPIQINVKSGLWRCFRCSAVGNWYQLTKAFGEPLHVSDRYKEPVDIIYDDGILKKFINEHRRPVHDGHYPELLDYCKNRGLSVETLKAWRVSSKGGKAFRWPIYDLIDGKWVIVNMKIRSIDHLSTTRDWFDVKGGATDLFIGNHLLNLNDQNKQAIICEGQWDAMTAWELGLRNVFSLPNGATNVNVARMLRFIPDDWEVLLCVDMDEAGDRSAERFFAQLGTDKVKRLKLPYKDLNEWLKNDPFLSKDDVLGMMNKSDNFFLDKTGFLKIDMTTELSPTKRIVCRTPWDELNDKIAGGLYEGQTTGLLGPSGQGKTTWVNQLAIGVALSQINVGLISVEGSRDDLMDKLRETIMGSSEKAQYKTIEQHLLISPLAGSKTESELYRETNRLIDAGARLIVVDNLDHMFRGDSQKKSDAYLMLIEQAVSSKTHFIVVWQPHKVDRGQIVNSGSQKGFSMSLQDADNYFNLNRIGEGVCIEIEKTRRRGIDDNDNKVYFIWDKQKRIYTIQKRFTNLNFEGKLIRLT